VPYCTVGAIALVGDKAVIDAERCTDCYVCLRNKVCPVEALISGPLETFHDQFRHVLSDPTVTTAETSVPGRGTEESKTNDVTGRVRHGEVGFAIDMGRPGVGVRLSDVEKVAVACTKAGLVLESPNVSPLGKVLSDQKTGQMQPEARDHYLLSVIIEGKCPLSGLKNVLLALKQVEKEIDSVFSLGLIMRAEKDGTFPGLKVLDELGIPQPFRGKVNVGLGRPLYEDRAQGVVS
jgi:hypothetical protein